MVDFPQIRLFARFCLPSQLAIALALLPTDAQSVRITALDRDVADLGRLLVPPGRLLRVLLWLVRMGELRFVPTIIEILE